MIIKIVKNWREATDWQVPIFVKMGATRVFDDVKLAAKAGADVIVVDGMEGGTGASAEICQEHTGVPTLAAVCEHAQHSEDLGLYGEVQLIVAGGIRHGVDAAKAMASVRMRYTSASRADGTQLQQTIHVEDYHATRTELHTTATTAHRALPRRDHDAGPRSDETPRHRRSGRARCHLCKQ